MSRRGSSLSYLFGGDDDEKKKEVVPKKKDDVVAPTLSKSISSNAYASGSNQVCYHLSLSVMKRKTRIKRNRTLEISSRIVRPLEYTLPPEVVLRYRSAPSWLLIVESHTVE